MIYILTPSIADFKFTCQDHGLPFELNNPEIIWVNHVHQFYGKKIFPNDKVIKGEQFHLFEDEHQKRLDFEIALRTEKRQRGRK